MIQNGLSNINSLVSRDFFQLQVEFAHEWSKKNSLDYDLVLFNNTSFFVRIFGYSDTNRPSDQNPEWISLMNKRPNDTSAQVDYFYNAYINFERNKPKSEPPKTCFVYKYHPSLNVFELHFVNADPLGNFSRTRVTRRIEELKKMFEEIKSFNHFDAQVKIGTWMLSIEPFRRLFPKEFTDKAYFLDTPLTQNYTHWGQFLTKDGHLKKDYANTLLTNVRTKQFDHINKYFPIPAKISYLSLPYFYTFYGIE